MSRSRLLPLTIVLSVMAAGCGSKTDAPPPAEAAKGSTGASATPPPALGTGFGNIQVNTKPPTAPAPDPSQGVSITEILAQNPAPDAQIATVNGAPIRRGQVDAAYEMYRRTLQSRGQPLSPADEENLRATTFRMVVADELLNQAAIKAGIKVPPATIDKAITDARSRVGTPDEWAKFMKDSKLTEPLLRAQVERNLRTDAYRKTLMANKQVTEQQAKEFYDRNRETFKVPESIHALVILLPTTEKSSPADRAEAKRLAEEAHAKVTGGQDFGAVARQYSQDPSAARGGDIGFVPRGVMFPASEQIAFALKPGEVSPVFETQKGYTVFKVLERKPEAIPTFEEVKQGLMMDMGRLMGRSVLEAKVKELSDAAEIVVIDPRAPTQPVAAK